MSNLLNNWLVQAIIANTVCGLLAKFLTKFLKWVNSPLPKTKNNKINTPSYSKKSLRKQFYISLITVLISIFIFVFTNIKELKLLSVMSIFWFMFFMYCAFECALDNFNEIENNRTE